MMAAASLHLLFPSPSSTTTSFWLSSRRCSLPIYSFSSKNGAVVSRITSTSTSRSRSSSSGPHHNHNNSLLRCSAHHNIGDDNNNNEERPESLFMKELKRRGMTPTSSLLEDTKRSGFKGLEDEIGGERESSSSLRNPVSIELDNQRERSMALNSEGLEGLIPRAKLLLSVGGTLFLGFLPLMLITIGLFTALYLLLGQSFVHDASSAPAPISPPPYVDPYELLEDERISHMSSNF